MINANDEQTNVAFMDLALSDNITSTTKSTLMKDKKRKNATNNMSTLSLYVCVQIIIDVFKNVRKCEKNTTVMLPNANKILEIYNHHQNASSENASTKRQKIQSTENISDYNNLNNDDIGMEDILQLSDKSHYRILLTIVSTLFRIMESNQVTFQFSKEHFKFFLATRTNYVDISEFKDSNKIKIIDDVKNSQMKKRSSKTAITNNTTNPSILSSGSILVEYYKNCDTFNASLVRCDQDDLKALKLIIKYNLRIDPKHYNWAFSIAQKFIDVDYKIDHNASIKENYTCIQMPSSNIKRSVVMITKYTILIYDGSNQFVLPNTNIERDFSTRTLNTLNDGEYVFFDVLSGGSKKNIIDIIDANLFEQGTVKPLSENYPDRLNLIVNKFKDLKPVDVKYTSGNCIKKPDVGFNLPSYIYIKPPLTGAVVGTFKKNAYIAFLSHDNNQLIIKEKYTISGPIASIIMVAPLQNSKFRASIETKHKKNADTTHIYHNEKLYEIIIDPTANTDVQSNKDNIKYLKTAIPVEIITTKLGKLSINEIAQSDEYKQATTLQKDTTIEEILRTTPIQDLASKLNRFIDTAALIKTLQSFQPILNIDDDF